MDDFWVLSYIQSIFNQLEKQDFLILALNASKRTENMTFQELLLFREQGNELEIGVVMTT